MNKIIATVTLILGLAPSYIAGQEVITLDKCRQMALSHNEDLRIALMHFDKARQQQAAARTLRLPSLSASGTGIYQDRDFEMELILPTKVPDMATGELQPNLMVNPVTGEPVIGPEGDPLFNMYAWMPLSVSLSGAYLLGLNVEQPLYTGGKIDAGNRMADIGIDMASENVNMQHIDVIVAADRAYWTYISVLQKVQLAEQALELLEELVKLARDGHEVGIASRNDVLKAQVELNRAELNLQKAKNGSELSRMELCRITGLPMNTGLIPADTLFEINQPFHIANEELDLHLRPEYRLLEKSIRLSEQNIRMARADFLPIAGIQAGYNHIGGVDFGDTGFSNTSFSVMGSVKIPIFNWGEGTRKVNAARIEKEMQEVQLEKTNQLLKLQAEQARLNLKLSWERIEMNENALQQAEENLRVIRDNYELGMETMTDLLIAQTHWHEVYSELIESRTQFKIKKTQWLKASGRLDVN